MAVYFQKAERPWWADLAKEGLSYFMKNMFERDAYARQKNRSNKEWSQVFGSPAEQVAAQEVAQRPAAMTVETSPDTNKLSNAITGATQTSPFGANAIGTDAIGAGMKINVPKEYLPNGNDGLIGTSIKANLANQYAQSQIPSREQLMRRVLTMMGPENAEKALKYLEYTYGPQWKVADQIYKGQQMENILGALPGMKDKEGNRNYNNRAFMYGMDNLASGNLNFLNPEYQRWFNEAEAAKQRAFAAEQQNKQFANQMRLARFNNAQANYRAQLAQAARAAGGDVMTLPKGLSEKDLNKAVREAQNDIANKPKEEAEALLDTNYGALAPFIKKRLKGLKTVTYGQYGDTADNPLYDPTPEVTPASVETAQTDINFKPARPMLKYNGAINEPTGTSAVSVEGEMNPDTVVGAPAPAPTATVKPAASMSQLGKEKLSQVLQYLMANQSMLNNPLSNEDEYTQEWVTLGNNNAKSNALKKLWGDMVQSRPNYDPYWIR